MSLAETQEIMRTLQEIMALLDRADFKIDKITVQQAPEMENSLQTLKQLERISLRYIALTRQLGLPDDIDRAIQKITQLIVIIRMAQMSLALLAGGVATTPGGIALAIASGAAGLAMAGLSAASSLEGY